MDENLNEKISSVLSDPQSLEAILNIAKSFSSKKEEPKEQAQEAESESVVSLANTAINLSPRGKEKERIDLLLSLRPFLREEKKDRVDGLIKALKTAQLINTYKNTDILKTFGLK